MNPITLASCLLVAGLLATSCVQAGERSSPDPERLVAAALRELPEDALKSRYRECTRAALQSSLGMADVKYCSIVYEALLQGVFRGDFLALLAWSRTDRVTAPTE